MYLKDGIGCPWASQSKAAPEFECVRTTSDLLRGGRRGGTLATGSTKHKMCFSWIKSTLLCLLFWMLGSLRWWKFLLWPIRQWQARSIYELAARDTLILYITISSRKWRNYSGIIRLCRGVFHDMFFQWVCELPRYRFRETLGLTVKSNLGISTALNSQ